MNDPHENVPDELIEDLLQPFRNVLPPTETQSANREAVRQALAMQIRPAWWRKTVAVPVPLAIAASVALLFAATFSYVSAFRSSGERRTAAQPAKPAAQEFDLDPKEPTAPVWTVERSFIRTLTSSSAIQFVASSPRENRDDS
jgi:hypothetical protein